MLEESKQVLILLIVINLALCSYYYLLYKDNMEKKSEDKLLIKLDEHFTKDNEPEYHPKEVILPTICNGFHDKFFNNNKYLGWRLFYLKNQNKSTVESDPNFKGIITQNYLDNMPNVKNEVTPIKNQIR